MIYLDYCSTTPLCEEAFKVYKEAATSTFANEQSLHDYGYMSNNLLTHCKQELASLLNGKQEGVYFTSGGSDSNWTALLSLAYAHKHKGNHIITSPMEHPSVYYALNKLQEEGFDISEVPVHSDGTISLSSLQDLIRPDTILVTIGHASSDTGVIQPLKEIGELLYGTGISFHSDAVQSFGKIPIDVELFHLTSLSISAHKIYGPKGVGACYIDPKITWHSLYPGAVHQGGFKPGTVDVPGIAAFTTAAQMIIDMMEDECLRFQRLKSLFFSKVNTNRLSLMGAKEKRLPHHLALRVDGIEGQWVMLECNRRGIAISPGSACKSNESSPPKSLLAMGYTNDEATGLFRISFGRMTTEHDVEQAADALNKITSKVPLTN